MSSNGKSCISPLLDAVRSNAHVRHNPYNGIVFEDCPQPRLYPITALLPQGDSDFEHLEEIRQAFISYGTLYRYESLTLRSGDSDFKIVHNMSGEQLGVQLKVSLVSIETVGHIYHDPRFPIERAKKSSGERVTKSSGAYFTPLKCWDWLLSVNIKQGMALFVSRDALPDTWFQGQPETSSKLHWKVDSGVLTDYTVTWKPGNLEGAVRGMERLLEARRRNQPLTAQIQRPFVQGTISDFEGLYAAEIDIDAPRSMVARPLKGTGRRWSRKQFEAVQTQWLRKLCEKK